MKKAVGIGSLTLVLTFFAGLCAAESKSAPAESLAVQLEAALTCRTPVFDGRQAEALVQLERVGAVVIDRQPGELPDLVYVFPSPIKVASMTVLSIRFVGGSGSILFARAVGSEAQMRGFAQRMGARPNPKSRWSSDGYEAMTAHYASARPPRSGLDEVAPRFVVGQTAGDDSTFVWRSRSFDG